MLVFTLEALPPGDTGVVRLMPHGRYAHDGAHARRVFEAAGLVVDAPESVVLREENKLPVQGWLGHGAPAELSVAVPTRRSR